MLLPCGSFFSFFFFFIDIFFKHVCLGAASPCCACAFAAALARVPGASASQVNASDCDVQYELHHRVAPERKPVQHKRGGSSLASHGGAGGGADDADDDDGGGGGGGGDRHTSSWARPPPQPDGGVYPVPRAPPPGAPPPAPNAPPPPLLCVDRPRGILPAHSRTLLRATFQPRRSGDFDLALCAVVAAVDPATGLKAAMPAEESALLRVGDR